MNGNIRRLEERRIFRNGIPIYFQGITAEMLFASKSHNKLNRSRRRLEEEEEEEFR